MILELRQQLKLAQQLVMTPQLQQAIKLLQLSRLELVATVQQELEQNPALEELSSSSDVDDDLETGQDANANGSELELPFLDRTVEINMDSGTSLREIDWQDYANEYEPPSQQKNRDSSDQPSRLDILTKKPNLQTHMQWQLSLSGYTDEEKEVGQYIIGNLNVNGFLDVDAADIARSTDSSIEMAERMITEIQQMDPAGVGARNVKESLLLQLDRLGLKNSLAAMIVRECIHYLETKNYAAVVKATGHNQEQVMAAIKIVISLDPYPGSQYSDEDPQYITPDVYIHKIGDDFVILLNEDGLPRLKISSYYKEILKKDSKTSVSAKDYIQDKLRSAAWLIKSIQQRQRTIYKVVESLIKFQHDFLEKGVAHLKPLVLRDVADDIGMHESTISRVTSNKYVHTPQGTFELKYFFNSSIEQKNGDALSSESIKNRIRSIVQAESPVKPLSDLDIALVFQHEGIKLARRTVAKYREQLNILPSKFRKKPKWNK
ncbi:MAG: RNA polymerase sigma-54 factor [Deltaproteobacteria bacterium RIFOXYD12_FULL_50_9]|nr:MAG: RNA polymerase sigma-54 factor [Deltaproteobacteria bacterium RIFOXYD12_FULL_50_9]